MTIIFKPDYLHTKYRILNFYCISNIYLKLIITIKNNNLNNLKYDTFSLKYSSKRSLGLRYRHYIIREH